MVRATGTRWVPLLSVSLLLVASEVLAQTVQVREPLSTASVRVEESTLADVVADAMRSVTGAEVALVAATSFAEVTIQPGNVNVEEFERALVFRGDTVVIMKLSGAQIRKALEHGLALYPAKSAAFLQVSGLSFQINPSAPRNERVENLKVGKEPLDVARTYTVAMPSPLASGALVYSKAWSKEDMERDTKITLGDALKGYLGKVTEISLKAGDRIAVRR